MNKIVRDYINGRIAAMEQYRSTMGDEKVDRLISIFTQLEPLMEDISNEKELQVAKKDIKDTILEAMNVKAIEDEKRRAATIQIIYNLVDYHHENVNSLKTTKEFAKDMGMSVKKYLTFVFKLALDEARYEAEEKGNSRALDL